jgi:DNA-binding LytR/AlgR family response regulator
MKHKLIFYKYLITIPTPNGWNKVYKYDEILCIVSEKPYTKIHCIDQTGYLVNMSLTAFEKILPEIFFRCDHSIIINMSHVKEYSLLKQKAVMVNGSVIHISHRHINGFVKAMDSFSRLTSPFHCCSSCEKEDKCCKSFCAKSFVN